ncbi:serine/threonine-protein kinase [Paenibacillus sacheonensis]|uniref:Protein kinase n=1 Tax=Paenibacillus sacheonensis TaxID=742054 RepID=A0A7X5BX05_9BACL|nr:serine/threonine-protein kinase [Paenibacillus sacheonensis]MBM7563358.1 serine/threonine-protein kinase [Paenibacillus sacheonensis]NBC68087.1 protein kinase [Paenibacillus sacheonensis]
MESIGWTSLENGTLIGDRYRIHGRIGKGGMGEVYAAEDTRLHGKIRALKVSRAPEAGGQRSAEEAGMLMRLDHPHLPLIVDYFPAAENGGYEVLVMDYIDGMTLQTYLEQQDGCIPASKAIDIGMQLAEALAYLHERQPAIIHRDLKPTNVMIDHGGFVRLIDFGIAREFKPGQTKDTVTLGTPGFAAPEQEGNQQSDARTDVFGLGALLHYLLTGGGKVGRGHHGGNRNDGQDRPYREDRWNGWLGSNDERGAGAGHGLLGGSAALTAVIGRMTDPVPACRYATMEEAGLALSACSVEGGSADGIVVQSRQSVSRKAGLSKSRSVIVASLSPGAGATFTTLTLAHLLDREAGPVAACVEHPSLEPEWHALLPVTGRRRSWTSPVADNRYRILSSTFSRLLWCTLDPSVSAEAEPAADMQLKHRLMLQAFQASVFITDVSSRWLAPEMERQLASCDDLLFVADPFPAKWTIQRLAAAKRICFEREREGRPTSWIANKDGKFAARGEWLASMPVKPCCSIPQLPALEWADAVWKGRWATANARWLSQLERGLQPVLKSIIDSR